MIRGLVMGSLMLTALSVQAQDTATPANPHGNANLDIAHILANERHGHTMGQ